MCYRTGKYTVCRRFESRCVIGPENVLFEGDSIGPENILFAGDLKVDVL